MIRTIVVQLLGCNSILRFVAKLSDTVNNIQ